MSVEAWLAKLDPAQVGFAVIAAAALGVFVWRKLWPWLVEYYFPQRARVEDQRTEIFAAMRDTLVELKIVAGQQVSLLQQQQVMIGHTESLLEAQRVILDNLNRHWMERPDDAPSA